MLWLKMNEIREKVNRQKKTHTQTKKNSIEDKDTLYIPLMCFPLNCKPVIEFLWCDNDTSTIVSANIDKEKQR